MGGERGELDNADDRTPNLNYFNLKFEFDSQTGYVCMVFYRRSHHVVEFQAGEAAPAPEEACSSYYFNPVAGHYTTLIGNDLFVYMKLLFCGFLKRWRSHGLPIRGGFQHLVPRLSARWQHSWHRPI